MLRKPANIAALELALDQAAARIKRGERQNAELQQKYDARGRKLVQLQKSIPPETMKPAPPAKRCQAFWLATAAHEDGQCPHARTTGDFCGHHQSDHSKYLPPIGASR